MEWRITLIYKKNQDLELLALASLKLKVSFANSKYIVIQF